MSCKGIVAHFKSRFKNDEKRPVFCNRFNEGEFTMRDFLFFLMAFSSLAAVADSSTEDVRNLIYYPHQTHVALAGQIQTALGDASGVLSER